ncbi:MAG TPA: HepT-like ribonuclease domain-containing protein [Lacisediminihabitans sp.]|uniref:HepT-like ribonuclease domain-containing protein n=1 Tax=Lacisediminihabitans sp. TaxID=2787631 RepID=UPI002ED809DA
MNKPDDRVLAWLDDLHRTLVTAGELADRGHDAYLSDGALPLAFEALSNRVGDLAKKLLAADPARSDDPIWAQAARNRDFVVHQYHRVDVELLWNTVVHDFPRLAALTERELSEHR